MSEIRVNSIKNASTTNGGISIDNAGHVTVDGQQMPTAGALSNRNLIINGEQKVDQRNSGSSVALSSTAAFVTDRWSAKINGGAATAEQDTTIPSGKGFSNSLKFDVTTADTSLGASDEIFVQTKIEAQDLTQLSHGTSDAQSVTFSFWVKSVLTGNYGFYVYKHDTGRAYQTTYNISAANTWEYKTITVPGDTSGAIPSDNGLGFELRWYLAIGTDKGGSSSQNAWGTNTTNRHPTGTNLMASTSNDWFITGVQLEVGEKATPFEHRSYGDELARCQRYFQDFTTINSKIRGQRYNSSSGVDQTAYLPVRMRAQPNVNVVSSSDGGANSTLQVDARAEEKITFEANPAGSNTGVFMQFKFTCEAEL